ncbi:MAG: hypothetical protein M0Z61_14660 [Nitrospiraceae bacterium]|nr:hypothetical protein [Nitrospiraceae bacterium]
MKRITFFAMFVFMLALFFGAATAMAQDSGGMENTPGGGTSNTPGGGTSNTPGSYERQMNLSGGMLLAQDGMNQQQMNPGMSNTTGLPLLSGSYSDTFESSSMDSAQQICDKVASANNKASCIATPTVTKGTKTGSTYYCVCK